MVGVEGKERQESKSKLKLFSLHTHATSTSTSMSNFYSLSDEDESESQLSRMANSSRGESSRMGARGAADTTNDTSISRGDNSRRKSRDQSSNEIAAEDDDDSWMNDESSEQRRERRRRRLGLTNDNNSSTRPSGSRSNGMDLDLPSTSSSSSRNNQSNTFGFGNVPNFIPELNFDDENLNMSQEDESDISKLARAWANERASPEILDWMEEITTNVVDEVNQQVVSGSDRDVDKELGSRRWSGK